LTTYTTVFPANIPSFPASNPRIDGTSIVSAIDVNSVYQEVIALAATLGTNPQTRPAATPWTTGSPLDTSTTYTTVRDRISNVENGLNIVYNDYVKKSGGTTIQSSATTVVSLAVSAIASQTADLFQAVVSGTAVTKITATGAFWTATIDGGTA
jgi:hypothetical protein